MLPCFQSLQSTFNCFVDTDFVTAYIITKMNLFKKKKSFFSLLCVRFLMAHVFKPRPFKSIIQDET